MNEEKPTPENDKIVKKEPETTEVDSGIEEIVKEAPPEVREFLEKAPPQIREFVMGMTSVGRTPHPIFDKFTDKHVDKFLDYTEEENKRGFTFASRGRWFQLGYVIIGLVFIGFLITYLLPNNKDLLINILVIFGAFAGGFGFGYGYRHMK
ncbi:MAG: hypothetical protein ACOZF2_04485 [Thermodesulfobacteriota bacterium]